MASIGTIIALIKAFGGGNTGGSNTGSGILQVTNNNGTLNKTWQEITDAGFSTMTDELGDIWLYLSGYSDDNGYYVSYWTYDSNPIDFTTNSANGYPVLATSLPDFPGGGGPNAS